MCKSGVVVMVKFSIVNVFNLLLFKKSLKLLGSKGALQFVVLNVHDIIAIQFA